jgi:hypothetical protein
MKLRLKKSLEPKLGLGDAMIDKEKLEVGPFIDCTMADPNPGAFNHTNCEILRIEYKRPHSLSHSSVTTLFLLCKCCGHKLTQYIV